MSQPFIGEIRMFGFDFAPRNWASCNGALLSIAQNTALFSILGTTYGGNGTTTFALPDLRGSVPVHMGQGPGLPVVTLGESGGEEAHTLLASEMPAHNHLVTVSSNAPDLALPTGNYFASGGQSVYNTPADTTLGASVIPPGGGSNAPHSNLPPILAVNFSIVLFGIFPSRN